MQHDRAMAVEHALGVAGRSRGVAQEGPQILVERRPVIGLRLRGEYGLIAQRSKAIVCQLVGGSHHDVAANVGQAGRQSRNDGKLVGIEEEDSTAGMVDGEAEQIGRAHVELQSLMRSSYAVFCLKK